MSFMSSGLTLAGFQPEDDIDKLFEHLSRIEPPGELIAQIFSHVRRLPGPLTRQTQPETSTGEGSDALVVRNEKRDPS